MNELADFFKSINEIRRHRIEVPIQFITKASLVTIPDEPVTIDELYDLNNEYRQQIGKNLKLNLRFY